MTRIRTWPSRRLQFAIIAVLVLGVMISVFWPPLSREDRAEKLYLDSWFVGAMASYGREKQDAAVAKLEAGLRLSPGNSLYEQALVWQYPRGKLPELLAKRQLGPEASRLAAGLIFSDERRAAGPMPADSDPPEKQLVRLDALAKADPTNSLVYYRKAFALRELGRMDEACAEMRTASSLGRIRRYIPAVSDAVLDSMSSPMITSMSSLEISEFRRLARALTDTANERLRQGKVDEARGILEDCCRMSVNLASSEPPTIMSVLVGRVVFMIAEAQLEPIYKDFGMREKLAALRRLDAVFQRALQSYRSAIDYSAPVNRMIRILVAPGVLLLAAYLSSGLAVLVFLWWLPAAIVRRRRRETALIVPPWSEGFLARTFLAIYIPILAVALGMTFLESLSWYPLLASIPAQLVLLGVTLRILHHQYDEHAGERTGILRFIFKAPAAAKAWTRKYLIAALGGQLVFLACCSLLVIIVFKPVFGAYPWQTNRLAWGNVSHEQAVVRQIAADLKKASLGE